MEFSGEAQAIRDARNDAERRAESTSGFDWTYICRPTGRHVTLRPDEVNKIMNTLAQISAALDTVNAALKTINERVTALENGYVKVD